MMVSRFRIKYHPDEYASRQEDARQILKHRCRVFMKLLELGWLSDVAVDNDHTNELIHVLDAGDEHAPCVNFISDPPVEKCSPFWESWNLSGCWLSSVGSLKE